MDKKITVNFADLIRLAKSLFENVEVVTDITPERSILRLQADYGSYRGSRILLTDKFFFLYLGTTQLRNRVENVKYPFQIGRK